LLEIERGVGPDLTGAGKDGRPAEERERERERWRKRCMCLEVFCTKGTRQWLSKFRSFHFILFLTHVPRGTWARKSDYHEMKGSQIVR
jgi:hypothetical protein